MSDRLVNALYLLKQWTDKVFIRSAIIVMFCILGIVFFLAFVVLPVDKELAESIIPHFLNAILVIAGTILGVYIMWFKLNHLQEKV